MNKITGISQELTAHLAAAGLVAVPVRVSDEYLLAARDDDGQVIFAGGVEHYFRSDSEACWYGQQVWRGLIRSLMDSSAG